METKDFLLRFTKRIDCANSGGAERLFSLVGDEQNKRRTGAPPFYDITEYLQPGDCLIVNDSRVLPAEFTEAKKDTGGHIEFLLLTQKEQDVWEVLAKPGRKAQPGTWFVFGEGLLEAQVLEILEDGKRLVRFHYQGNFMLC